MIQVEHLYKGFEGKSVLEDVNLEIYDGETLAVIGRSGSGKSVLTKHLIGLLKPDRGRVLVDGVDINADPLQRAPADPAAVRAPLPGRRPLRLDERLRQRRLPPPHLHRPRREGRPAAHRGVPGDGAAPRRRGQEALGDLGRDAEAGGAGARHRPRAAVHPLRRAHERPRPRDLQHHQRPDQVARRAPQRDLHRRHARHALRPSPSPTGPPSSTTDVCTGKAPSRALHHCTDPVLCEFVRANQYQIGAPA